MRQMWILEKLNFKISLGKHAPGLTRADPILAGPTLNCFRRACYLQMFCLALKTYNTILTTANSQSIIAVI